jgi:hypothetical protein
VLRERERERKKNLGKRSYCAFSQVFSPLVFYILILQFVFIWPSDIAIIIYMGIGFTDCFVQSMERILRYQGNISLLGYTRICKIK